MRVLMASSLLTAVVALGACSTAPAPAKLALAPPTPAALTQTAERGSDVCDAVHGTANAHHRQTAALDRSLGRNLPRPVASTPPSSVGEASAGRCQLAPTRVRREGQRARRNAAIDRALSRGV